MPIILLTPIECSVKHFNSLHIYYDAYVVQTNIRFRITTKSWRNISSVLRGQWCYQQIKIFSHILVCYPSPNKNLFMIHYLVSVTRDISKFTSNSEAIVSEFSLSTTYIVISISCSNLLSHSCVLSVVRELIQVLALRIVLTNIIYYCTFLS